jgi:hypothetical protein
VPRYVDIHAGSEFSLGRRVSRKAALQARQLLHRDLDVRLVQRLDPERHPDRASSGVRRTKAMLRVLGLSGRGTSSMQPSASPYVQRLALRLRRFVHVEPLAVSATNRWVEVSEVGEDAMKPEYYDVDGRQAVQFDLSETEHLNVEPYEGYFSMAWSSQLPLSSLLLRVIDRLRSDTVGELTVQKGEGFEVAWEGSDLRAGLASLISYEDATEFWRLDAGDQTLTWERSSEPDQIPNLMGLISDRFDPSEIQALLALTATASVGEHARELVSGALEAVSSTRVVDHSFAE